MGGEQDLPPGFQRVAHERARELARCPRVERLVEVVDRERARGLRVRRENHHEEHVQRAYAGVVPGEGVAAVTFLAQLIIDSASRMASSPLAWVASSATASASCPP